MSDLISRQAVLDAIQKLNIPEDMCVFEIISHIEVAIATLPSVENKGESKTGHWINAKVGKLFPSNDYKCSICGNILDFNGVNCGRGDANFCPNYGADMRKKNMSEFYIDSIFQQIEEYEREWREHREQELAKICEEHDFIVGSPELKLQLLEHLPNGANVVYSKWLDDPTLIVAIRKFSLSEYLMPIQYGFIEVEHEQT